MCGRYAITLPPEAKAGDQGGVSSPLFSPAALTELARLLAREAAQAHFTACEGKGDSHHDQTD